MADRKSALVCEIGRRIQARRKQLGLTQEQTAELSGSSQQYIANVEKGKRGLGDDSIIGLSKALQVSTDYILLGTVNDRDCRPIMELIQPLSAEQLLDVQNLIGIYLKACGYSKGQE